MTNFYYYQNEDDVYDFKINDDNVKNTNKKLIEIVQYTNNKHRKKFLETSN